MNEAKDDLRADRKALLDAVRGAGGEVLKPNEIRCPFHKPDNTPSGSSYKGEDGAWRFKCHGCGFCGDAFDVLARANGTSVEEELAKVRGRSAYPTSGRRSEPSGDVKAFPSRAAWEAWLARKFMGTVEVYDVGGPARWLKARVDLPDGDKTFSIAHGDSVGRVIPGKPEGDWPLFLLDRPDSDGVVVVEGERKALVVHAAGLAAAAPITGAGGDKAKLTDWSPLKGRLVYLWPDHDPADPATGKRKGHEFMRDVAEELRAIGCAVWWVNPADLKLGDKCDVVDYLGPWEGVAGWPDAMSDAIDMAKPLDGIGGFREYVQEIIDGKRINEPIASMPLLTKLARGLLPGCVMVVIGEPGAKKSFFVNQLLIDLKIVNGTEAAVFALEDDRNFHALRALAQLEGNGDLTDDVWVRQNPVATKAALERHAAAMAVLMASMSDAPDAVLDYAEILAWMEKRAGVRVQLIDPITAIDVGKDPWNTDKAYMARAKAILRKHRSSAILVTHPRGANSRGTVDDAAGSRAFGRFAQSAVWLKPHPDGLAVRVVDQYGNAFDVTIDAELKIVKARNGRGQHLRIGLQFDDTTLKFIERGVIKRVAKKQEDGGVE